MAATIEVIELRLRHGVVDVDGWNEQFATLEHLIQTMHTRRGFLGYAANLFDDAVEALRVTCE